MAEHKLTCAKCGTDIKINCRTGDEATTLIDNEMRRKLQYAQAKLDWQHETLGMIVVHSKSEHVHIEFIAFLITHTFVDPVVRVKAFHGLEQLYQEAATRIPGFQHLECFKQSINTGLQYYYDYMKKRGYGDLVTNEERSCASAEDNTAH